MLRVSMSQESNLSTLCSYIFIYIGIDAIIKTWKIGEDINKINVDMSLPEWFMLRRHATEKHLFWK